MPLYCHEARARPETGELIDVFPSTGKRNNIVMANVYALDSQSAGHAHYLRHVIRTLVDVHSPGRLLDCLNLAFDRRVADFGTDCSATMFLAALQGGRLTYASAGHDLALLMHANGRHRRLPLTSRMLGRKATHHSTERSLTVVPGDWLILVTDGITHAQDAQGAFFGARGVVQSTLSAIRADVDDPAARILAAARAHCRGGSFDDAAVLCVHFSS
jgi:phosphoserine phosphatase RsbU/P